MSKRDLLLRFRKYKYLVHVFLAMVAGVVLIVASTTVTGHRIYHALLDEFGVAIIVAGLVTLLYETYAREVLFDETGAGVLAAIMGDLFDTELWGALREQLLSKKAVRRGFSVRISLTRDPELPQHQAVLWVCVLYRLHAVHAKTEQLRVYHYLDRFMRNDNLKLPGFEHITVGAEIIDTTNLTDVFEKWIDMSPWTNGIPIVIERREIVYTPGAYNLLMSDLTALETVQIEHVPADVDIEVNWTLDEAHKIGAFSGEAVNRMLLPGHSIEFRFHSLEGTRVGEQASTTSAITAGS